MRGKMYGKRTYAHVDIPGWVSHNDMKLAQYGIIKRAQVAVNPLWR